MKTNNNVRPMVGYKETKSNVIKHICFFCLIFIFFIELGSCQKNSDTCKCDGVTLSSDGIYLETDSLYCNDTIIRYSYEGVIIEKIYLKDCFGTLFGMRYNLNGVIKEFGSYIGDSKQYLDTMHLVNPVSGEFRDTIVMQRHPNKNGLWLYFNDKGQITKEEMWQDKN